MNIILIFEGVNLERWVGGGEFFRTSPLYTYTFPPPPFQLFYLPLSNSVAKGKLFLGKKYFGGGGKEAYAPLAPQLRLWHQR